MSKLKTQLKGGVELLESQDVDCNVFGVPLFEPEEIELELIESELIKRMAGADEKTVVLRAAESVDLGQAVEIMDIAYRNQFKIVLATQKKK